MAQATKLMDEGNPNKALSLLEAVVDEQQSYEFNRIYIRALLLAKQYTQAYREAMPFEKYYLLDPEHFNLWIKVLLNNSLFIPARIAIINYAPKNTKSSLISQVAQYETKDRKERQQTVNQQFKNFYHIGDLKSWEQRQAVDEADHLPLKEYLQAAQFVIRDPFAKYVIKSAILQTLSSLQYDQEIKFLWFNQQEYSIVPADVPAIDQTPQYTAGVKELRSHYENEDPIAYQNNLQQFNLYMMYLYPRIDQTISDIDIWLDVMFNPQQNYQDHDHQSALELQNQIKKQMVN